ncbi:GNAT family N-acetyltransferase [Chloroflexia bacterium SDU3-3]|nr:GNAT family N-acetyltransferase [Chloroflexia bacterium SDU3-3]
MSTTAYASRTYAGEHDLQPIVDLLNLCDSVDKLDDSYGVDDLRNELTRPHFNPERDIQLWEEDEGQLIAYAETPIRNPTEDSAHTEVSLYIRIHPEHRTPELAQQVLAWADARLHELLQERQKPVEVRSWAPDYYTYMQGLLEGYGMQPVRYFFSMDRDLTQPIPAVSLPEGYTLRHVENAEDEEKWVDAYNWSFIDHYNFHPRAIESHRHLLTDKSYRRERDLIAVAADGSVAAIAFCWIDEDYNQRNRAEHGWVYMLGVRRGHRKLGLGRSMLLAGITKLHQDGMKVARLNVDAENPSGALQLYQSAGFVQAKRSIDYWKRLDK